MLRVQARVSAAVATLLHFVNLGARFGLLGVIGCITDFAARVAQAHALTIALNVPCSAPFLVRDEDPRIGIYKIISRSEDFPAVSRGSRTRLTVRFCIRDASGDRISSRKLVSRVGIEPTTRRLRVVYRK